MKLIIYYLVLLPLLFCMTSVANANEQVVNVYAWAGIFPDTVLRQFEKETGIKVNFSTYDNNEILYAKLRASPRQLYDVIEPSSYYIDRMRHQNMLEPLDKTQLSHWKNLNPEFLHSAYDLKSQYSTPFSWGITGIFLHTHYFAKTEVTQWSDFWKTEYVNKLMLLDDAREVFSMALLALGYSVNDTHPEHIKAAYNKLKKLMPNVKVFTSETAIPIMIDEDATIGMAWNGDVYKASLENSQLQFIFPQDGFVIWVDNLAIPKGAPHKENAHRFINFMLRTDIAKAITLYNNYATTNLSAQRLLPSEIKDNPVIYPPPALMHRGTIQMDVGDKALALYEKYWEALKMGM